MSLLSDQIQLLKQDLRGALPSNPTQGQSQFIHVFSRFITSQNERCSMILKGYAGTGKTTMLGAVTRVLTKNRQKIVLLAPTGRAAKVMGQFSDKTALTIHKKIYRRTVTKNGSFYTRNRNLHTQTLFVVDEVSMIGNESINFSESSANRNSILDDLMDYVFEGTNCRLLLVGDNAQLPPVGLSNSPALDLGFLKSEYYLNIAEVEFTEVVRQKEDSGILMNATQLRELIREYSKPVFPAIRAHVFDDVINLSGEDVRECIEDAYSSNGRDDVMIITRSNKRANYFNGNIRSQIMWHDDEICSGDSIMIVKNNYHWITENDPESHEFIANGDILEVKSVRNFEERYGLNFVDATIKFKDYPDWKELEVKLLLDVLWDDGPNLNSEKSKELYRLVSLDYAHLKFKKDIFDAVKKDPYMNALQIKYAYAITCHKSQGGQWPVVLLDQGYFVEDMLNKDYLRWLYTAMTRASEKLILLQFNPMFLEE